MALHQALASLTDTLQLEAIRCGGGIGIFKLNTDNIDQIVQKIHDHLSNTNTIKFLASLPFTIQHTMLETTAGEATKAQQEAQQKALKQLEAQSHLQQLQMPSFHFANCFNKRDDNSNTPCELDGKLPQSAAITYTAKTKQVSDFSAQRFDYGREQKHKFINKLLKDDLNYKYVNEFASLSSQVPVPDKDKYKRLNKLKNKLAILYFDGNHFGVHQKNKNLQGIQSFEKTLQTARKAFIQKLVELLNHTDYNHDNHDKHDKDEIRLELLLWGGDEIMLAVPAWAGFSALHLFYQTMQEKLPDNLSHAGGLVFCSHKTPIKRIIKLARELAEEAKNISRQHDLYYPLLLESEDYPTQSIIKHWQQHYGRLGKALLPLKPFAGGQPGYHAFNDPKTSRSALYKTIHDLYYQCQPDTCQPEAIQAQTKTIIEKSGNGQLDANTLARYFPLFAIHSLTLRNHPDKQRLQSLITNSPDLLKIQPWVYLVEYGDYLINLPQLAQNNKEASA